MDKWIDINLLDKYPEATDSMINEALDMCMEQVKNNLPAFEEHFPAANSEGNFYTPGINTDWTSGFWTGEIWLSYENAKTEKDKKIFETAGKKQVDSFLERINIRHYIDHHDMGFLYIPSCVAAYSLISYENAKEAAIKAADQLCSRYRPEGKYIQAWGEMWARDNARLIIDCMLNVPLLYRASEVTKDEHYAEIAKNHIITTMKYIIRDDDSTWHTIFFDPDTGEFSHGATCQGYKDASAWARGQAWGIYGTAIAYKNTGDKEYIKYFERVSKYFLKHLPKDLCPYWDLSFGDGDENEQPRDSSSGAIAVCGFLEMSKYLDEESKAYYTSVAKKIMYSLIKNYQVKDKSISNGQLLHGTYAKKTPYNTCKNSGVDECVIWGDYFFMEALTRLSRPDWKMYW